MPKPNNPTIFDEAVCLGVTLTRLGVRRKVPVRAVQADTDKSMLHVSKNILDSPELKAVQKLDNQVRTYIASRCLPSIFRAGVYLLPLGLIEEVDAKLKEFREVRTGLVADFLSVYQLKVQEAKVRLRELFSPLDYPDVVTVAATFGFQTQYLDATAEITQVMRRAMLGLVNHMVDRLTPGSDGKQKIFRNSLVKNLRDYLATFDLRNVTGDDELSALVTQARNLLSDGVSPDALRDNQSLRQSVEAGMTAIKAQLDTMVILKPQRAITLEEEE